MGRRELANFWHLKKKVKETIFLKHFPKADPQNLLLFVFAPEEKQAEEFFFQLLEGIQILPLQIIVFSKNYPPDTHKNTGGKLFWIHPDTISEQDLNNCLMASDMALIFHEDQKTIHNLFEKGIVPVGLDKSPLLANYRPNEETGNSFTFHSLNPWDIFSALVRASETYRFPYDWQHIVRGFLNVR